MSTAETQGNLWDAAAQDWAELFEPMSSPLWVAMLNSADVIQGAQFLDLGCGGGGGSVLAAKQGARVSGLDAARALIEIARKRLPDADFRIGDLEELPYADNTFDVTFASMSIMFAANPLAALREMKRVTIPRGRVTIGIWGKPEDCEYRHILKAVADTMPSPPQGKGPFALSGIGVLEDMMETAGIKVVDFGEADAPFLFADFQIMWRIITSAGPIQLAKQLVSERDLQAALIQATKPFQTAKGSILLHNRFRFVTAVV